MSPSRLTAAGYVVDYWRDYFAEAETNPLATEQGTAIAARHALGCVASALLGQTDPAELGIGEERRDDFRRIVSTADVELELSSDELREILYAVPLSKLAGTVTDRGRSPLHSAMVKIRDALGPEEDSVVGRFLAGWRESLEHARVARMAPRWEWLRRAIVAIDRTVKSDPSYLAHADAIGAYVRDTFDALGLSVRDPETLYVALVTASTLVELASNGHGRGAVSDETLEAVAKIAQSFAASVIPYLPDEAKP